MARERFRDSDPVEEILRIAMENQGGADASLRQRLLASASELGISEQAVLAAQQQWEEKQKSRALQEDFQSEAKRDFLMHLGVFFVINFMLFIINRLTSDYPWVIWPVLGWGIGLGCHAVWTLIQLKNPGGDEFEDWKRKRERRASLPLNQEHRVFGLDVHLQASANATSPPEPPSEKKV